MPRAVSIRRSLLVNVVVVVALLGATIMVLRFLGTQRSLRRVSETLITQALERVDLMLDGFFDPVVWQLGLVADWSASGVVDLDRPEALDEILLPVLMSRPWIASIGIADESGREYRNYRLAEGTRSRFLDKQEWGDRTRESIRGRYDEPATESDGSTDYDPRLRPWFIGALERFRRAEGGEGPGPRVALHWAEPYEFFESGDPGISVSTVVSDDEGRVVVLSADLTLADISEFTGGISIGEDGGVFVLSSDGRLVGLPRDAARGPEARRADLLKMPGEVGAAFAGDAAEALLQPESLAIQPERFVSEGEAWWGEVRPFRLPGSSTELLAGVVVPERDLLLDLVQQRLWIGGISLLAVLLAVVRSFVVAQRYSRPIEALAAQSNRIGAGDLDAGEAIETNIAEVRHLAEAQDRMRVSLKTLLKIEKELQLAKEIQERTFPQQLPLAPGYDLAAWNEPADETGGDSYDVIGFDPATGELVMDASQAGRWIGFLLADATGHGIGPALSVTQLRAMLRMAVRLSAPLGGIVGKMNEQLCSDLPSGRFITAWFGILDPAEHSLATFSAGQAPLLFYRAAEDRFEVTNSDAMPLGLFPGMKVVPPAPIDMQPGDIFAAISDGIFEAARADDEEFGVERVQTMIRRSRAAACDEILEGLREAVDRFTDHAPADDDKTIILIKRVT